MDDTEDLLTIGAFARCVGLAPSALRFYDDCGVLRPARVDAVTGYRRYGAGQAARAVQLRQLRAAGLPLVDVAVVLDGPADAARDVLRAHLERTRRTADEARAVVEGFLREATGDTQPRASRARVGGAEFASAVRQVAPAAATGRTREDFPVLGCVLLELLDGEVRFVATDRYRLALRVLRPMAFEGVPRRVLISAEMAWSLAEWAVRQETVEVECTGGTAGVRLRSGVDSRGIPEDTGDRPSGEGGAEEFPDYRLMLEDRETGCHRVIVDRAGLRDAVTGRAGAVSLSVGAVRGDGAEAGGPVDPGTVRDTGRPADRQVLEVAGGDRGPVRLRAVHMGPGLGIAFDPAVLVPALEAGVGPDVLLEIASADRPVVVRSADQGSFTTLVMPVRERAAAERPADGRSDGCGAGRGGQIADN
ncbi:DNA polymerase III beta subunit-like protein [Streptomyces sp. 2333.5]|uniref:MerR family transcriptional regulator n=1 Tax=unclassified Streptomyces TaxID=2593676 RepID=UPI000B893B6F|nr:MULTISPECIES: MerR family transcriptional regulator [unclassified Streptomyces]PJJ03211.1 DNA polymerase III beta subunit-like protein [Streptomyces sp. 2333.5]